MTTCRMSWQELPINSRSYLSDTDQSFSHTPTTAGSYTYFCPSTLT